jgi:Fe-S oxidoreductase
LIYNYLVLIGHYKNMPEMKGPIPQRPDNKVGKIPPLSRRNALELDEVLTVLTGCGTVLDCLTQTPSSITILMMAQEKI